MPTSTQDLQIAAREFADVIIQEIAAKWGVPGPAAAAGTAPAPPTPAPAPDDAAGTVSALVGMTELFGGSPTTEATGKGIKIKWKKIEDKLKSAIKQGMKIAPVVLGALSQPKSADLDAPGPAAEDVNSLFEVCALLGEPPPVEATGKGVGVNFDKLSEKVKLFLDRVRRIPSCLRDALLQAKSVDIELLLG